MALLKKEQKTQKFDYRTVEKKLGYEFRDISLLKLAFTHSSYANEANIRSNENLEFLGDSILNFIIAEYLYMRLNADEGILTVLRSKIVSESPLALAIDKLAVAEHLHASINDARGKRVISSSIKSDLFEAIVGAIYVDSESILETEVFVLDSLKSIIDSAMSDDTEEPDLCEDYKGRLQLVLQERRVKIDYRLVGQYGTSHEPRFVVDAVINGQIMGSAEAGRKKTAEQLAAKQALITINKKVP